MKTRLKTIIASFLIAVSFVTVIPVTATFAASATCGDAYLIGSGALGQFPAWYNGLLTDGGDGSCVVESPSGPGLSAYIWTIVLNIVQCLTQAAGYIAAIFIIYGGLQFIMNGGETSAVVKARITILNAVIGLVVALVATTIVKFIIGNLTK